VLFLVFQLDRKARIATESICREDFLIEAYDILELLCELLLERIRLIDAEKECPFDLREAVCTLIYAADRTEVKELSGVKDQLVKKFGKAFGEKASQNKNNCVNERVIHKLSAQPPNAFLVYNYMKELAEEHGIDWVPDEATQARFDAAAAAPTGSSVTSGAGSGLGSAGYQWTDGRILRPGELPPGYNPDDQIPRAPQGSAGGRGGSGNGRGGDNNGGGGGGDFAIPVAPGDIPVAPIVGGGSGGGGGGGGGAGSSSGGGGFQVDDIPSAPGGSSGGGNGGSRRSANRKNSAERQETDDDDPSTFGADSGSAVPDYDELAARFSKLKGGK